MTLINYHHITFYKCNCSSRPEFQRQISQAAIEDMAWMSNYNTGIYVYVIIYLCPKLKAGLSNLYQQKVPLTFSIQTSRLYLIHMGLWNEAICKYSTLYLNPDKWWWDKGHIFTQNSAVIYSPILIIYFYSLPLATIYMRHGAMAIFENQLQSFMFEN